MIYYLSLVLLWAGFYASHSILASVKVKRKLEGVWGDGMKWYRLLYSLISLLFLGIILWFSTQVPYRQLMPNSPFGTYVGYMLATFGTIILVKSGKSISIKSFLGIVPEKEKSQKLITEGLYKYTRHPLYAGLLLIFLGYFFVSPTLSVTIHCICLIVYLPFGIYFEEKNLVSIFGSDYQDYQDQVPQFFPRIGKKKEA
ncbi:methyltransferase family protein [Algoriphagus namhaensis]|uniref:Methyltransferase family protein n=1 Tax=Algoriphagus namhaensis TaxID=915353 RepID=A0ABV8APJ5_9BACT